MKKQPKRNISSDGSTGYPFSVCSAIDVDDLAAHYTRLLNDDELLAVAVVEAADMPRSQAEKLSARAVLQEPVLCTPNKAMERSILNGANDKPVRYALGTFHKRIILKPLTLDAAKLCSGWQEKTWTIRNLMYSSGYIVVTHKGEHSQQVWPSIKLLYATLSQGFKIIR